MQMNDLISNIVNLTVRDNAIEICEVFVPNKISVKLTKPESIPTVDKRRDWRTAAFCHPVSFFPLSGVKYS